MNLTSLLTRLVKGTDGKNIEEIMNSLCDGEPQQNLLKLVRLHIQSV
jgi:hypothetical protein